MGRTAPLTSKRCILYIYSTNIGTEYFKHALYSPFFSSKCSLFHNANLFGSCIIHILYTGCAKIKKNNSGAKGLMLQSWSVRLDTQACQLVKTAFCQLRLQLPQCKPYHCQLVVYRLIKMVHGLSQTVFCIALFYLLRI
jgi:hypothetical protein